MVQATTAVAAAPIDHPRMLTKQQRQKIARDKYRLSARGKLRRKLQRCGVARAEIDRLIRVQFGFNRRGRKHATNH